MYRNIKIKTKRMTSATKQKSVLKQKTQPRRGRPPYQSSAYGLTNTTGHCMLESEYTYDGLVDLCKNKISILYGYLFCCSLNHMFMFFFFFTIGELMLC